MTEHRSVQAEIRVVPEAESGGNHEFWARVLTYDTLDDYETEWAPGVFSESLGKRMPRLAYGHSGGMFINSLVGRGVDHSEDPAGTLGPDDPGGLNIKFRMSDFEAVPSARQFWSQMQPEDGAIDQFSVGFGRQVDEPSVRFKDTAPNARRITKGWLQEVSGVMTGAVPGTQLLSLGRSTGRLIGEEFAQRALTSVAVGQMDLASALLELRDASTEQVTTTPPATDLGPLGEAIRSLADLDEDDRIAQVVEAFVALLPEEERAAWTNAFMNNLPDSAFAYIKPGGAKDGDGKTAPRSLRYFPHHGPDGKVDLPHARNAASRIPQASISEPAKARAEAHIKAHLEGRSHEDIEHSAAEYLAEVQLREAEAVEVLAMLAERR